MRSFSGSPSVRWSLAVGADRPGVPVGGVSEARAELEHAAGADRAREHLERHADVAPHDREAPLRRLGLHLQEDRLVETAGAALHVRLDARIHDVHDGTVPRGAGVPRPAVAGERRPSASAGPTPVSSSTRLRGETSSRPSTSAQLGEPGSFPFTRGVTPTMYRGRLWTMRQYAGMGTAEETNRRFRYLLEHGQTGLSVAFDLPTQMGLDSDHPRAEGEVGKTGVAIDSIEDMRGCSKGSRSTRCPRR